MTPLYRYRITKMARVRPNSSSWKVVRGSGKHGSASLDDLLLLVDKMAGGAVAKALEQQLTGRHRAPSGAVEPRATSRPADMTGWRVSWHRDERDDAVGTVLRTARGAVRTARQTRDIWAEETARSNALALARDLDSPVATKLAKRILAEIPTRQQGLFGARANPRDTTNVQTLLFDKAVFTPARARAWAERHGYRAPKVDAGSATATKLRVRQHAPNGFFKGSFHTVPFGEGVSAVVGRPRQHAVRNPAALPVVQGLFVSNPASVWRVYWFGRTGPIKGAPDFASAAAAKAWLKETYGEKGPWQLDRGQRNDGQFRKAYLGRDYYVESVGPEHAF